jgi:hypothetical protein
MIIKLLAFSAPIVTFLQGFALPAATEPARSAQERQKAYGTAWAQGESLSFGGKNIA